MQFARSFPRFPIEFLVTGRVFAGADRCARPLQRTERPPYIYQVLCLYHLTAIFPPPSVRTIRAARPSPLPRVSSIRFLKNRVLEKRIRFPLSGGGDVGSNLDCRFRTPSGEKKELRTEWIFFAAPVSSIFLQRRTGSPLS